MSALRPGFPRLLRAALLACLLLCGSGVARAADWALSPSLSLSSTYDSNTDLRFEDQEADFITSIKPRFVVTGQTEQDQFNLDTTVNGMVYVKDDQLDRVETSNSASWSRQWSPRFSSNLGAAFTKTTALESQLQEAGIRTILADQYNYSLRARGSCVLSEGWSVSLAGNVGRTWYPDKQFPDADDAMGNLTLTWKYSPFDTFGMDNIYSLKHYSGYTDSPISSQTVQYVRPGLYWEHAFSETMSLLLGAGYRMTGTELKYYVPVLEFVPPDRYRLMGRLVTDASTTSSYDFWTTLRKSWTERLSSNLSAGRDQYSDTEGETYNHMFVGTGLSYRLSELTLLGLDLRYDYNSGIDGGVNETHYFQVTPTIARKLTKDLTLRLGGCWQVQTEKYALPSRTEAAHRFLAWVELLWELPRLVASK